MDVELTLKIALITTNLILRCGKRFGRRFYLSVILFACPYTYPVKLFRWLRL